MKRIILAITICSLCLSLCACGITPNADVAATPATTATPAPMETVPVETDAPARYPLVSEPTYFSLWGTLGASIAMFMDTRTNNPVIQKAGEITGVYLDCAEVPSTMGAEQFGVLLASDELPDFVFGFQAYYPAGYEAAVNDGFLVDLMPYLDEYAPEYKYALESHDLLRDVTTDSGYLSYFCIVSENTIQDRGIGLRKDWLDKVGLDIPETYDELEAVLTAFKTELDKPGSFFLSSLGASGGQSIAGGFGVADCYKPGFKDFPYTVQDGEVIFGWTQEEYKQVLKLYNKWYEEDLLWKDFFSSGASHIVGMNTTGRAEFSSGKLGCGYMEVANIDDLPLTSGDAEMEVIGIVSPTLTKGEINHGTQPPAKYGYGFSLSTSCEDIETAIKYMNFYYTQEGIDLANYGIVGQACEIVDGKRQFTDLILNNEEGMSMRVAINVYCLDGWGTVSDKSRENAGFSDVALEAAAIWLSNSDSAWYYPISCSMTAEEAETWSTLFATIDTYHNETVLQFITGELDIDAGWEDYLAQMEELGASEATMCRQAAYNRYIER